MNRPASQLWSLALKEARRPLPDQQACVAVAATRRPIQSWITAAARVRAADSEPGTGQAAAVAYDGWTIDRSFWGNLKLLFSTVSETTNGGWHGGLHLKLNKETVWTRLH